MVSLIRLANLNQRKKKEFEYSVRAARRRTRRPDALASTEAVRGVLGGLRSLCAELLPANERQLVRMLESVRHYGRRPATGEGRGRPRRWPREDVAVVAKKLKTVLRQETGGRVSPSSFVSLYLPILRYPADVSAALGSGEINIREAAYIARLTPERLKCKGNEARRVRGEMIKGHILTNGSQNSLRLRVKAMLGENAIADDDLRELGRQKADALLRLNPHDARHLFFEEIQRLTDAMRQVEPDDIKDDRLGEFLRQIDKLFNLLRRMKR
jgi:hypothetical protein